MKSFHGNEKLKKSLVKQMRKHRKLDELVQGHFWENNKGCWAGCLLHSKNPIPEFPKTLGIPRILAQIIERTFERLPRKKASAFAVKSIELIPVGVDLETVWKNWFIWMLVDKKWGVVNYVEDKQVVIKIAELYKRSLIEEVDSAAFRDAATDAATDAANATTTAAAADATADATAYAYAAYAAAYAAAAYAAAAYAAAADVDVAVDVAVDVDVAVAVAVDADADADADATYSTAYAYAAYSADSAADAATRHGFWFASRNEIYRLFREVA